MTLKSKKKGVHCKFPFYLIKQEKLNVLFLFNRSSTFRILEAYYSLFQINALLEVGHLLEGGIYWKKSQKRGAFIRSITIRVDLSHLKSITNTKNQFFMQNKFYIILIYWSSIFKKLQYVFCRKPQKFDAIKTQIFSLTFLLFLQTIQLLQNICCHTVSQELLYHYKRSSC